jgi:hypothetical protein
MNPAHRYTLAELLAILCGALAVNLYLVHRDRAAAEQITIDTRAAEAVQGPVMLCEQAPDRKECEQ